MDTTRRSLIRAAAALGAAGVSPRVFSQARPAGLAMTKQLSCGAIGVEADQRRAIGLARQFGFGSVEAQSGFLPGLDQAQADDLNGELAEKGLVWGCAGLPVDFRGDEAK
jgi:hypothetical protein